MGKATEEHRRPPITREAAMRIALAARAMLNATLPATEQVFRRCSMFRALDQAE